VSQAQRYSTIWTTDVRSGYPSFTIFPRAVSDSASHIITATLYLRKCNDTFAQSTHISLIHLLELQAHNCYRHTYQVFCSSSDRKVPVEQGQQVTHSRALVQRPTRSPTFIRSLMDLHASVFLTPSQCVILSTSRRFIIHFFRHLSS
jgi:hypothetical protein